LMTESMILGAVGAAAGLILAFWGVDLLVALAPAGTPRLDEVVLDGRALAFGVALAFATGIVFGMVPALQLSRVDVAGSLKESGGLRSSVGRRRLRSLLVGFEVAIAMVLLVGAGLMMKSFVRLQAVDPGFNPERAIALQVALPSARYADTQQANDFYTRLLERIEAQPGIEAAGAVSILPMSGDNSDTNVRIEGQPVPTNREDAPVADYRSITPGYLAASGMRLLRGRWITDADRAGVPDVVLINETMARRYWPNTDALGKRIGYRGEGNWATVIGVVADIHHNGLDKPVRPEMYMPQLQMSSSSMWIVARTRSEPLQQVAPVRAEVRSMDAELPIAVQTTMSALISQTVALPRLFVAFFGFFATVALLLAAVGVYGVTANAVTQQSQEIGIRMALGANAGRVVGSIVGHSMLIAGAGVGIGAIGALLFSWTLRRLLFDLSPRDPATFATIAIVLTGVVLVASWTPARRAATVDPAKSLRIE
jgi:putative ABC transport system permease protein